MTSSLLLRNVTLIDGLGGAPRPGTDVLVTDGLIASISPTGALALPQTLNPDALTVLDGTGHTVLPGFFDCHVHVSTSPATDTLTSITEPESAKTLRAVPALRATLDAGVTSARDLAGADSGFRDAIADGVIPGPALQLAIRILSVSGGHGDWRTVGGTPLDTGPGAGAVGDSPADFVRLTREVIREGADWIKVAATGGMGSPRSNPEGGGLSEAELRAVVAEAARHGHIGVAAHSIGTAGIMAAVRAGVRSIEHGYLIDDATIELMGEQGTYLVPTLATLTRPVSPTAAPWAIAKRHRTLETARDRVGAAIQAGVNVALGTDAGIVEHGSNLRELALLVEFGLTPMQAILAGTSAAARMSGILDEVGTIEVGKRADLVATRLDPLAQIGALADPGAMRLIVQSGRIHLSTLPLETTEPQSA
ncbi:amidohydrolase family protein [Cryobacterium sp. SO2]|uniref:metal-dependent hydrolase family protein n=1 Tax=Cryobacterium sp. SO2 TaxID=1897060 RepID=UPI00223D9FDD|nr:amidohydrolase family protein [Cryobacterium sp. SO2]WEO76368.1 amidohydrolase family protein [Cryobacterium sp. SO2]